MVTLDMGATAGSYTDYVRLFMNLLTALVVIGSIFRCVLVGLNYMSGEQSLEELVKKIKKIVYAAILCGSIPQIIALIASAYGG